jgi:hypothetical protein
LDRRRTNLRSLELYRGLYKNLAFLRSLVLLGLKFGKFWLARMNSDIDNVRLLRVLDLPLSDKEEISTDQAVSLLKRTYCGYDWDFLHVANPFR